MPKRITLQEMEDVETCDHCGQAFNVSLPDEDEHRYVCEEITCQAVICFDCKNFDVYGNDWCPDCAESPEREWQT